MPHLPSPFKTKHPLTRKPCCIFLLPRLSPCMRCGARGGESEGSDRQVNTFLLCCILYWRQEYPSFYCTLIYYSETGDKVSRESASVCPQRNLLTPARQTGCQNLLKHDPHTQTLRAISTVSLLEDLVDFDFGVSPIIPLSVLCHVYCPPSRYR